jgi:hypothetical protein
MGARILEALRDVEKKHGVKIIYACESGSRAWGFASDDSDYDVRFLYVQPLDCYLSVGDREDVIEMPSDGKLDINGWDIRKSLRLLQKSNSVLLEWLSSPVKYRKDDLAVAPLGELSRKAFMPKSSCQHYLGMAKKAIAGYPANEKVKIKSYLYTIRPVLCCRWIVKYKKQAPMLIDDLIAEFLPDRDSETRQYVDQIIEAKKAGDEGCRVGRSHLFESYLHSQIEELEALIPENGPRLPIEEFDDVFRKILRLGIDSAVMAGS